VIVGGRQQVARLDSGALSSGIRRNSLGLEAAWSLNPPDAVGGRLIAILLDEIETRAYHGRSRKQSEEHGNDAGLKSPLHGKAAELQEGKSNGET
jgi:hypothetical protein